MPKYLFISSIQFNH